MLKVIFFCNMSYLMLLEGQGQETFLNHPLKNFIINGVISSILLGKPGVSRARPTLFVFTFLVGFTYVTNCQELERMKMI